MRQGYFLYAFFTLAMAINAEAQTLKTDQKPLTEEQKIDYLITSVEQLEGAKFYRNGSWHDAKTAADHLRMKRSKAGNRVKTAKDFIDKVASASSMSGEEYKIKYADGKIVTTKEYFTLKLKEIEGR